MKNRFFFIVCLISAGYLQGVGFNLVTCKKVDTKADKEAINDQKIKAEKRRAEVMALKGMIRPATPTPTDDMGLDQAQKASPPKLGSTIKYVVLSTNYSLTKFRLDTSCALS